MAEAEAAQLRQQQGAVEEVEGQVIQIDAEQLAQLLAQSADGTAQILDEEGNTITLTAEQLAAAGFEIQTLTGGQPPQQSPAAKTLPAGSPKKQAKQLQATPIGAGLPNGHPEAPTTQPKQQQSEEFQVPEGATAIQTEDGETFYIIQEGDQQLSPEDLAQLLQTPEGQQLLSGKFTQQPEQPPTKQQQFAGPPFGSLQPPKKPIMPPAPYRNQRPEFLLSYQCDQCPKRFAAEHHLRRHMDLAHAQKRPFYCRFCKKNLSFHTEAHFQAHLRMQHSYDLQAEEEGTAPQKGPPSTAVKRGATEAEDVVEETEPDWEGTGDQPGESPPKKVAKGAEESQYEFECQDINVKILFSTIDAMEQYLQANPVPEKSTAFYRCLGTGKQFLTLTALKNYARELGPRLPDSQLERVCPFLCQTCGKRFSKTEHLDQHRLVHMDVQPHNCHQCARKFKWKENLMQHLKWHQAMLPHHCPHCTKSFTTQGRLDAHIRKHQEVKKKAHQCPICSRQFYERDSLAKHLREHRENVFPCPECDKKFVDEKYLQRHMQVHTQNREHTCTVCGKAFVRAENLKAHRYLHTGEKPHRCAICSRGFTTKWSLSNHMKMHTDVNPCVCEHCGRSFRQKGNLDLHLRIHAGLRPFQCSSCMKTFNRMEHLQTHINAHQGIRPYPCTQCDRAFYNNSHLNQHVRIHHGEKPYQCGTCGKAFAQKSHLQKHLDTHTKDQDGQYVVIWEKGGSLQEACMVNEGTTGDDLLKSRQKAVESTPLQQHLPTQPIIRAGAAAISDRKPTTSIAAAAASPIIIPQVQQMTRPPQYPAHQTAHLAKREHQRQAIYEQLQRRPFEDFMKKQETQAIKAQHRVTAGMQAGSYARGGVGQTAGMAAQLQQQQLQFVDEQGNPVVLAGDQQVLILDESSGQPILHDSQGQQIQLDAQALAALTGSAHHTDESGAIYITEEDLQNLAQQGIVLAYQ